MWVAGDHKSVLYPHCHSGKSSHVIKSLYCTAGNFKIKKDSSEDKEVKEVAVDGSLQNGRKKSQTEVTAQHHCSGTACCQDSGQPTWTKTARLRDYK